MEDILPERRALLRHVGLRLGLGQKVDRGSVECGADGAGQESAVVVGIIPGKTAFVVCIFPERRHEFYRLDRRLGVEDHGLAVSLDLLAAPGPDVGVAERRRITEGMPERLSE